MCAIQLPDAMGGLSAGPVQVAAATQAAPVAKAGPGVGAAVHAEVAALRAAGRSSWLHSVRQESVMLAPSMLLPVCYVQGRRC
jgi:hypothetical protein